MVSLRIACHRTLRVAARRRVSSLAAACDRSAPCVTARHRVDVARHRAGAARHVSPCRPPCAASHRARPPSRR
eukprot:1664827-Prymnesium_polylepis.2